MAYCTQQNLIDRFGELELIQLSDRTGHGVIDATVVGQAIADADAEINAYLLAYSLPLSVVPAHLTSIACDIVRYRLLVAQEVEPITERYKIAIRYLEQVATGKIRLMPDNTANPITQIVSSSAFKSDTPVFNNIQY